MRPLVRELLAGGSASGVLVGLAIGTQLSFVPLLALAAGVYLGVRFLLPDPADQEVAQGLTRGQLGSTLEGVRARADRFEALAVRLERAPASSAGVPPELRQIATIVRDLIVHFERDPATLETAADFVDLQLPKALEIVERYAWLAEQPHLDARARGELAQTEQTIDMMTQAFVTQHNRLLADDFREFQVDRRVFEELLRLDGQLDARYGNRGLSGSDSVQDSIRTTPRTQGPPPIPPAGRTSERNRE